MRFALMGAGCFALVGLLAPTRQTLLPNQAGKSSLTTSSPKSATVPLILEDNRVFVELSFRRPDGSFRKARTWVDTGGGWFAITESLANDIGAKRRGEPAKSDDGQAIDIAPPTVYLGDLPLDLSSAHTSALVNADRIDPGIDAEAFLPARVLMHYQVVFDYPARRFTLARPGVLQPQGRPVSSPVQKESGFPRIEIEIDGKPYGFLLDTGAAYTMISRNLLDRLAAEHPNWPRLTGAVGEANMLGDGDTNALLVRLRKIQWGPFEIQDVGVVSRPTGTFETYMSRLMTDGIVGAVAGNVLRTFRVEIDYANGVTYLEQATQPDANDLDSIGIIFQAKTDGSYYIAGLARKNSEVVAQGSTAGDRILQVDGFNVTGATRDAVIHALAGKPGDTHKLAIERDGKRIETKGVVKHLL